MPFECYNLLCLCFQINITYFDVGNVHSDVGEIAKFGTGRVGTTAGLLVHVRSGNSSSHHGCELNYENELPVSVSPFSIITKSR